MSHYRIRTSLRERVFADTPVSRRLVHAYNRRNYTTYNKAHRLQNVNIPRLFVFSFSSSPDQNSCDLRNVSNVVETSVASSRDRSRKWHAHLRGDEGTVEYTRTLSQSSRERIGRYKFVCVTFIDRRTK